MRLGAKQSVSRGLGHTGEVLALVVQRFGWSSVLCLAGTDAYGSGLVESFVTKASLRGITATVSKFQAGLNSANVNDRLAAFHLLVEGSGARIIVLGAGAVRPSLSVIFQLVATGFGAPTMPTPMPRSRCACVWARPKWSRAVRR